MVHDIWKSECGSGESLWSCTYIHVSQAYKQDLMISLPQINGEALVAIFTCNIK